MAPIATTIPTKISVVVFGENLIFFPLQSWGVQNLHACYFFPARSEVMFMR
jgi:hypothetical protein